MNSALSNRSTPARAAFRRAVIPFVAVAVGIAAAACAGEATPHGALLPTVRDGDLAHVRELLKTGADPNARDTRGNTALHWAALNEDLPLARQLLRSGANPNATNNAGATPLIYGAGSERIVAELLKHKADPNLAAASGNTPLHAAASRGDSLATVKLLVNSGAAPDRRNEAGITPLTHAALTGDARSVRLLLDRGASPNPTNSWSSPLISAVIAGHLEIVRLLLDHGADPRQAVSFAGHPLNFALYTDRPEVARLLIERGADLYSPSPDGDKTPPVVWAAYTDTGDPAVMRLLLEKGVDVNQTTESGENALAWALKRGRTPLVDLLRAAGADESAVRVKQKGAPNRALPDDPQARRQRIRAAAQKAVDQLQRGSEGFLANPFVRQQNCVSCHHQTLPAVAFGWARERGLSLDEAALTRQIERLVLSWSSPRLENAFQVDIGEPQPDAPNNLGYGLIGLHALGYAPDELTEALSRYLATVQNRAGHWPSYDRRPPIEDGPIVGTALTVRALHLYPPPRREREMSERIGRARRWLLKAPAKTQNERAFQLLGLVWAGEKKSRLRPFAERIVSQQRPDGGWGQLPGLESDAWATGQALVALHDAGALTTTSPVYQRGLEFLLRTQFDDGSWWVRSRSWPFQPHFDSGFPHGKDQWVSAGGTAWAAMALLLTLEPTSAPPPQLAPLIAPPPVANRAAALREAPRPVAQSDTAVDFVRDIQPLFERSCAGCHSGEKPKGQFRVSSREHLLKGGQSSEPAIVPGQADHSFLLRLVRDAVEDLEMPPLGQRHKYPPLSAEEIDRLQRWIETGAPAE